MSHKIDQKIIGLTAVEGRRHLPALIGSTHELIQN